MILLAPNLFQYKTMSLESMNYLDSFIMTFNNNVVFLVCLKTITRTIRFMVSI